MNTKTIARNSVWLGAEFVIEFIAAVATSVAIARELGPAELGYYVYISWLTRISIVLGNVGLPASALKYMAQYWASGNRGVARSVFEGTVRMQVLLSCLIAAGGWVFVLAFGDSAYRLAALLLVLSIIPAMVNTMPTVANIATENPAANVPGSIVSVGIYTLGVTLSLLFGWRLTGVAASLLLSRTLEAFVRAIPVKRWIREVPCVKLPEDLRKKMKAFSAQSIVLMVLGIVVWDRSEILFLKHYAADIRQIAYYSVSFGMAENILGVIRIFGNSIGTTMRAQFGRDEMGLRRMLPTAVGYIALLAFPLYFGLASLSRPTILLAYGHAYAPAVGVLMVTALLTVPKAFQVPLQSFLQASERQGFMVWWGLCCAGINLSLDWLLIPRYGALGAAYGNGLAQLVAATGLWIGAAKMFDLLMPYRRVGRSLVCSLIMGAVVCLVSRPFGPVPAALVGIPVGIVIFFLFMRLSPLLDRNDLNRLLQMRSSCPPAVRVWFDRAINLIIVQSPRKTTA